MILKTAYQLVQNSGQKRPKSRLRKFSKRDARALDAIKSSGAYDQGGITSEADMDAKGMFVGDGLPVGTKNGRVLKDNSDAPIAILSRPGGGKGTCLGFPMMAEWRHSSLIIDVDGEYARGVSAYRRSLGHEQIFLNPHNLFHFPCAQLNPFQRVVDRMAKGDEHGALDAAREAAFLLLPDVPERKGKDGEWVIKGGRKIIEMALMFLSKDRPDQCNLAELLQFLSQPVQEMLDQIGLTATSVFAVRRATAFAAEYQADAQKQVIWRIEEATEPLQIVQPGSLYDRATRRNSIDPRIVKTADRPVDYYLMVKGRRLESEAIFIALLMSYIIEEAANAPGNRPFLVLADEFSQLAKSRVLIKAIRAYRKRGIKIVTMSQGRQSTIDRYGPHLAHDIEDMAGTKIWIDPPYQIARELSDKAGTFTATSRNIGDNPGGHYSTTYSETPQPVLPVSELVSGSSRFANKMIIEHAAVPGLIVADKVSWWEIHPYADQLSDAYRDDFYRYQPEPITMSRPEALSMFGLSEPCSPADIRARVPLLKERFPAELITGALAALGVPA